MEAGSKASPRHRQVRPRYGRVASALSSLGVTSVAVLGATGLLPGAGGSPGGGLESASAQEEPQGEVRLSGYDRREGVPPEPAGDNGTAAAPSGRVVPEPRRSDALLARSDAQPTPSDALPTRSGSGRRVVFDMSGQRVWIVGTGDRVRRTYLVSGSVTDNLAPGTYEVYSTSRHAVGIDDSGTMQYMVRFAHGQRAAIGFHDIPVSDGELVQSRADLGTPQSHGCIRQWRPDARALWDFASVGTKVVVTA